MTEHLYHSASATFEAALRVPILPPEHRSRRLHGHSYRVRVQAELSDGWAPFAGAETDALQQALAEAVAPLDYAELNAEVPVPTDENLARWIRRRLAGRVPGVRAVGVRSTADTGVDLDAADHAHLWHRFRFEAAHRLPRVPAGHPCGRMHGHGFEVILHADQDLAGADMGIDFDVIAAAWAPLADVLHHACLNDLPGLENPTSELLSQWIWQRLRRELPALSWVSVYETATAGCHYDGKHYRIWKDLRFESALRLIQAPEGDGRRRLHGHSYLLRLHLVAPLDEVLGWTVDYGDVKALFKPVYARLDHHRLDELPGLEQADPGRLARWIRSQAVEPLPQLARIDLQQTPGCGAMLCWGDLGPALPT
ncbi:6-pyruvoyl tetrahydropterin synthase [Thiohalocapsa marina]|uniref:6-carboxy-5,6,7,8-tetrahydropterin synthase n=1 Tax=Thiohalocapsa marina TaxID=424902 RepID=A0A5M8FT67_9GAMM|nr:6-carboxytetrahydropterin synthase [Thiohalocapsa marina]KAA6186992.1 6-pyruvoyl tetrahydropterin synthase [Thiohalocapsa marina]